LGLVGWVTNRSDGAVEAEFEGPLDAVSQAVAWCRRGPAAAEVSGIDVAEIERCAPSSGNGRPSSFHVR
jgi:acylphosphatase